MSREKQIEEMAKVLCEDCARDVAPCSLNKSGRMCDSVREQAEALYEAGYRKQEWISVEERLPENDYGKHWKERQHYLVMTEPSGLMRVARFGSKEFPWWIDSHDTVMTSANYAKVTHWMPLPEPPNKGGADNGSKD